MLLENRRDELRITQIQTALDQLSFSKSMINTAHQHSLRTYIKNIQMSIFVYYAETGKVPNYTDLEKQYRSMFRSVEIKDYKIVNKKKYSFVIKSKKSGASAFVEGDVEQTGTLEIKFQ